MATVVLDAAAGATPAGLLPRRVVLTRPAVERLAGLVGAALPWTAGPADPAGPAGEGDAGPDAEPIVGPDAGPDAELRRRGLISADGTPFAELPHALAVLATPEVTVDLDLVVRRGAGGHARLRSWQRLRGDRVTSVATAGGPVELAWHLDRLWAGELARAVTVTPPGPTAGPPAGSPAGPPAGPLAGPSDPVVEVAHDLLLASGEAHRLGRPDLAAALLADRPGADPVQLHRLHAGALGRMRTVVAARGADASRIGWLSWVLYADGWRALTPYVSSRPPGREAMVRVHPVAPGDLGPQVAALVARVRA